jgi:hypothetical protein
MQSGFLSDLLPLLRDLDVACNARIAETASSSPPEVTGIIEANFLADESRRARVEHS